MDLADGLAAVVIVVPVMVVSWRMEFSRMKASTASSGVGAPGASSAKSLSTSEQRPARSGRSKGGATSVGSSMGASPASCSSESSGAWPAGGGFFDQVGAAQFLPSVAGHHLPAARLVGLLWRE